MKIIYLCLLTNTHEYRYLNLSSLSMIVLMLLLLLEIILEDPVLFYSSDVAHITVQSSHKSDEDTVGDN